MSLAVLANQVRAKGRGDDTMLVHMTPGEVHGLQSLAMAHGGSLSINPDTGLPEAGILKSLLPTLIGAVLTPLTGGLINPLTAGLLVGGVEGLRTGDIGKGLMAGLGAYGGAGLTAGLAGLGGAAKAATIPSMVSSAPGATAPVSEVLKGASKEALKETGKQALGAGYSAAKPTLGGLFATPGQVAKGGFAAVGEGAKALAATPAQGLGALGRGMGTAGVTALGSSLASAMTPEQKFPQGTTPQANFARTTYNPGTINPRFGEPGQPYFLGQGYGPMTRSSTYQEPPYIPAPGMDMGMMPQTVYAEGGPVPNPMSSFPLSRIAQPGYSQPLNFTRPMEPMRDYEPLVDAQTGDIMKMAGGGLSSLGSYSDGGQLLKGPGDGMSDDIPATIQGAEPQKAALADGEFVVPADVVSGIGNGSTEAGSRALYAMMDRVRMARTGKKDQAPEIEADKYMPA